MELQEGTLDGVPHALCPTCGGLLVELRHNVPLLDRLGQAIGQVDADSEIAPHPGASTVAACPKCGAPMERFGYLGTNRVFLDRCGRCLLLWHDGDELGTTVALHVRTTRRSDDRARRRREETDALNRRVHAALMARVRSDRMGGLH